MRDHTALLIQGALAALAERIEKVDIPQADALSKSDMQTENTQKYFSVQTEELKEIVKEIRAFRKEVT